MLPSLLYNFDLDTFHEDLILNLKLFLLLLKNLFNKYSNSFYNYRTFNYKDFYRILHPKSSVRVIFCKDKALRNSPIFHKVHLNFRFS